ncbi:translesion DNA synthesis-associated protein ImuA [Allohahella sp. A8]|uniref:translesion DNA synthesis-associated protein ImuA n=1 Tax=Allohahella sp. A8 TaxID=3141461 RepID=UPI003A807D94
MSLEQLIDSGRIWRYESRTSRQNSLQTSEPALALYDNEIRQDGPEPASEAAPPAELATGYPLLDRVLTDRGWPCSGVTEVLYTNDGIGELSLLLPALRTLSRGQRWIIWIAPPFQLNSIALAAEDIDVHNHIVLSPESDRDFWWACEEAIKSGACSAVLAWPGLSRERSNGRGQQSSQKAYACLRRLQIAAAQHKVACFLYRQNAQAAVDQGGSPSSLRLQLRSDTASDALMVEVLKQRGPRPHEPMSLKIPRPQPFHYSRLSDLKHLLQTAAV